MKWGHILSMPEFFADTLSKIRSDEENNKKIITFGQSVNLPKRVLTLDRIYIA